MGEKTFEISSIELQDFSGEEGGSRAIVSESVERLAELKLDVRALLGKRIATIAEIETYKVGDVLEVERIAGHSVDVYVGSEKIAVGEVVVMEDKFALVVSEAVSRKSQFLSKVKKNGDVE